ncbi:MAG: NIPSNAP family protein [Prosthecobacter sp.]|uniref:NIPSNAP family protein n=1 Tax=Prosthecobacter sp. TaxID=1965333 RepID=UPI0025F0D6B5|nr:NIPSNAP family protein [Prosthecobacter sp.]MCF7788000.1 NIPSNAP family protein [Prosthecobacter sp.]
MTRSTFLKSTVAASGLVGVIQNLHAADAPSGAAREYFEIRKYTLKSPEKQGLLDAYLKDAAIPALNRLGVSNVGVFVPEKPETKAVVYVVLRYSSLDQFAKSTELLSDTALQQQGAAYLDAPAADAVYERVESWLTKGIAGMPAMAVPAKGSQVYQLRIYESPSEKTGKKKIEMFNIGELEIFQRSGLNAVFFGETIVGPLMPNLTYMLSFSDAAAKDQAWNTFRVDPEWTKLKTTPGFTDKEIVSRITNIVLVPTPYSQI